MAKEWIHSKPYDRVLVAASSGDRSKIWTRKDLGKANWMLYAQGKEWGGGTDEK